MPASDAPSTQPPRRAIDWLAIASLCAAIVATLTCMPLAAGLAGFAGFVSLRRARRAGASTVLPLAALITTGLAVALQLSVALLTSQWLAPAMQKRTNVALAAAIAGDRGVAVPKSSGFMAFSTPLPAPSAEAFSTFATQVREPLGDLRSISVVSEDVGGSAMTPTISMPLVLEFERGSATGWARVQWVPAQDPESADWLPAVRVLEMEVNLPNTVTARLEPEAAP